MTIKSVDLQLLKTNPKSLLTILENEEFAVLTLQDAPVARVYSVGAGATQEASESQPVEANESIASGDSLNTLGSKSHVAQTPPSRA